MTRRFCVRCGAEETSENPIVEGLCLNCFVETYGVAKIVRTPELVYCHRCGAIKLGGRWLYASSYDELLSLVREIISRCITPSRSSIEFVNIHIDSLEVFRPYVDVSITFKFRNTLATRSIRIPMKWTKQLCPACFDRASKRHQAVVQLRWLNFEPEIEEFKEELLRILGPFIIEIEEHRYGYDIKLSSEHVARKILDLAKRRWHSLKVVESFGDVKRTRDGRRVAKKYISIRILNAKPGNYVVLNNRAYTVESVANGKIVLVDSSGRKLVVSEKEFASMYTRSRQ